MPWANFWATFWKNWATFWPNCLGSLADLVEAKIAIPTLINLLDLFKDHQGPKTDDSMGQIAGQANHFNRRSRAQHSGTSRRSSVPSSTQSDPQKQFLQLGPAKARELLSAATGSPDPLSFAGPISHGRLSSLTSTSSLTENYWVYFFAVLSFRTILRLCLYKEKMIKCFFSLFFEQIIRVSYLLVWLVFKVSSDQI